MAGCHQYLHMVGARFRATGFARLKASFRILRADFGAYRQLLIIVLRRATPVARQRAPTGRLALPHLVSLRRLNIETSIVLQHHHAFRRP